MAIQMKEWKDVLPSVVGSLGSAAESHACILDFLRVLPEEVTEGRKINLSVRLPRNSADLEALYLDVATAGRTPQEIRV